MEEKWICVKRKNKNKNYKNETHFINIEFTTLCQNLRTILSKYNTFIEAGFIYGSRARETNRPNSDVDIIMFWKRNCNLDFMEIRKEIETKLGITTDFVSCILEKKTVRYDDIRDIAYFENIMIEARIFIGEGYLDDLIFNSRKLPLLPKR